MVLGLKAGNLSRVSRHSAGQGAEEAGIWVSGLREALRVAWEDGGRSLGGAEALTAPRAS